MTSKTEGSASQGKRTAGRANQLQVVPQTGGWAVVRAGETRATGLYSTQADAIRAAREVLRVTGGELRIQGRDGRSRSRESFTLGRDPMASISAVEGIHLTADMKRDFRDFDRRNLSADKRRRAIASKYGKGSA